MDRGNKGTGEEIKELIICEIRYIVKSNGSAIIFQA